MNDLHFLIHNLAELTPDYDRKCHRRIIDLMVDHWSDKRYITCNYIEKKIYIKFYSDITYSKN